LSTRDSDPCDRAPPTQRQSGKDRTRYGPTDSATGLGHEERIARVADAELEFRLTVRIHALQSVKDVEEQGNVVVLRELIATEVALLQRDPLGHANGGDRLTRR